MFRLLIRITIWLSRSLFKSDHDLRIENLALRQQLAVFKDKRPRPKIRDADQAFWAALRNAWPKWTNALILVKPETVTKWHRKGFRLFSEMEVSSKKAGATPHQQGNPRPYPQNGLRKRMGRTTHPF